MSKNKILIVEDERITAEDLKNTLENMGYEVTGMASSADTFYKSLNDNMPDLVLMDIYLKGKKDGIELATEVKEKYQLPIIYLTAYSDSNILERAKITEPFGFIMKPFQERELHSNIEMALHKNRMELRINHLNAILKAIRDVNQLIVRVNNVKDLVEKTCEILVSSRAYTSAWFLTLDNKGILLDSSSAGVKEGYDVFIQQFRNGNSPECVKQLKETDQKMCSMNTSTDCEDCFIKKIFPGKGTIIAKVGYKERTHGFIAVSMPIELTNDEEETELFIEIADDLGFALNTLEQQKKKDEAEEKLISSEEKLRALINAMPDLVCFKDGEGRWLIANEYALNLFGLNGVDYIGKTDAELAEYSSFYREAFMQCEATDAIAWEKGSLNRADKIVPRPDGTVMIFDSIKIPSFDSDNRRKGLVVVERDITERKHSEQELQKLSQVVQQSPNSIIVTDTNGSIEYANPAASRISGYAVEELIGNNPSLLSSGETPKEEYKKLWDTINAGNEWKGEFHNRKKNGELYWERATISPIKNKKGIITHFLGIKEDITARKYNESIQKVLFNISRQVSETSDVQQLLEIVRNELSTLINTKNFYAAFYSEETGMLTSAYGTDEKGMPETWPAEKSLTGYVIRHNKSLLLRQNEFEKLMETGEVELVGANSEIWLGVPLTIGNKPYGAFVVQDYENPDAYGENELKMLEFIASQVSLSIQRQKSILDLQDAFVKAEAGDKLKTAFINNISHEIRTPLNGILGFTEMTLNPDSTREDNELFFSIIKKSSKRLLNTITSYMDISMLVSGTMEITRRPSNLDKLISEIHSDFLEISTNKGIEIIIDKPDSDEPLLLNTDIEKLRKIINHLLDNAVKFSQKGTITFGYNNKDSEFEFFVSDTGTGIKSDALNVIFDAFMQADVSSTRGYEGSGLGLTIANGLVKLLGGKLWVDSERGRGSTFYFTLPFSENSVLTPRKANVMPKIEPLTKPLILVAEDDDSNYKYIEIVLLYASYEVIRAENGIEAVECCRNHPEIRLVLMDIKMPLMDGFEATRQIKSFMPGLPVIALTAHVTTEDENLAIASGCNEYVTKPVSKAKLLEIIEDSLILN